MSEPVDIGKLLDDRAIRIIDKIEETGDSRALSSLFRTLVEWGRSKPAQEIDFKNLGVTITPVAGNKSE